MLKMLKRFIGKQLRLYFMLIIFRVVVNMRLLSGRYNLALCGIAFISQWLAGFARAEMFDPCKIYPPDAESRAAWVQQLIKKFGFADFVEPPIVRPTSEASQYDLVVEYTQGKKIAGCPVELRSYNGNLIGSTIRAKPGDTLYIRLINKLPNVAHPHPQVPHAPEHHQFSFNITNLHTHGLHTSPSGNSDNVLLEIAPERFPGDPASTQLYRIHIHDKHPAGTFWYHAHVHGSTGVQVSSGMAGALIIEGGKDANGGLDSVPEIQAAEQKVFVLQQVHFGPDGKIENFAQAIPDTIWSRNITVNGVFVPTIRMRPGEVQRWRFIHAGVQENMALSLDGHQLHEIAADGLALGRSVSWPATTAGADAVRELLLAPGYRSDVLVKAAPLALGETSKEYFLRDGRLPPTLSLQVINRIVRLQKVRTTMNARQLLAEIGGKPDDIIARIIVEGEPREMALPRSEALRDRMPSHLEPIKATELTDEPQEVRFDGVNARTCTPGGACTPCEGGPDCDTRFTINERVYMPQHEPRKLKLGQASQWTVVGDFVWPHPFHIHVNPFEVERSEPGPDGQMIKAKVWKDTIMVPLDGTPVTLRSRYTMFDGEFVIHCHILGHEDMGMMQRVRIIK